jgi:hypothetical protein
MNNMTDQGDTIIYQSKNGALELKADTQLETIWLTQQQVAQLFDVQKAAISKHANNIFESEELKQNSTVSKMETVQTEGNRRKNNVRRASAPFANHLTKHPNI